MVFNCYKYTSLKYGIRSLIDGEFKVTAPAEFNDPLDCVGIVTMENPPREALVDYAATLARPSGQSVDDVLDSILQGLSFPAHMNSELLSRRVVSKTLRVMSLSDANRCDPNSEQLLWSHYADDAKGVRIRLVIDTEYPLPTLTDKKMWSVRRVSYPQDGNLPLFDMKSLKTYPMDQGLLQFYHVCVFTKGHGWAYENEIRLVVSANDGCCRKAKSHPEDAKGTFADVIDIPRSWVKGIDFGIQVKEGLVQACVQQLVAAGYDINFRWARVAAGQYGYSYWNLDKDGLPQ